MTEFEEKMINETRTQTAILSQIKSYVVSVFVIVCLIFGLIMAI